MVAAAPATRTGPGDDGPLCSQICYILLLICRQNYYPPYPEDDAICGLGRINWPWNSTAEREPEFDIIRAIAQPGADDVFWHMTRYLAD